MELTAVMSRFFGLLTIVANVSVLGLLVVAVQARRSGRAAALREDVRAFLRVHGLTLAWLVALTSTLGSLYYSEVANFVPCKLCWYQRIAMYPLVVVLGVAALRKDRGVWRYAVPIALVGGAISIFHYTIERFPNLAGASSCDASAPCTVVWTWQFHYISIPFMALSGFLLITSLLMWARPDNENKGRAHAREPMKGELLEHGSHA
jgi:disulfide bond formation protein DsbB